MTYLLPALCAVALPWALGLIYRLAAHPVAATPDEELL